jgi:hypothetical protein
MVRSFLGYINYAVNKITNDEEIKIKNSLSEVKGMLDIRDKDNEISENLKNLVSHDSSIKIIESKIAELLYSDALSDSKQFLNLLPNKESDDRQEYYDDKRNSVHDR